MVQQSTPIYIDKYIIYISYQLYDDRKSEQSKNTLQEWPQKVVCPEGIRNNPFFNKEEEFTYLCIKSLIF